MPVAGLDYERIGTWGQTSIGVCPRSMRSMRRERAHEGFQRLPDTLVLCRRDEALQHAAEAGLLQSGNDVLPAIRLQHQRLDALALVRAQLALAHGAEVA